MGTTHRHGVCGADSFQIRFQANIRAESTGGGNQTDCLCGLDPLCRPMAEFGDPALRPQS